MTATPYPERDLGGTAGQALRVTFRVVRPALSVADARAEEGTDKTIDFTVTLALSSLTEPEIWFRIVHITWCSGEECPKA